MKISALVLSFLFLSSPILIGQNVKVTNGGMEDESRRGSQVLGFYTPPVKNWWDCGRLNFPKETPPDIHPQRVPDREGAGGFWNNKIMPHEGSSYLGMVVRENNTWESMSQRLEGELQKESCYQLSVWLVRSREYRSRGHDLNNNLSDNLLNFTTPTVLRIWGSDNFCGKSQLLAESEPVKNHEWQEYSFTIKPKKNFRYITIEAFYETPVWFEYNGHILLDNLSDFIEVSCDTNEPLLAEVPEEKIKPNKEEPKKEVGSNSNTSTEDQIIASTSEVVQPPIMEEEKPKIIKELDRKTLKAGQVIRINKLFFEADTSSINDDSFPVLDELSEFLVKNYDVIIEVGGHTNSVPTADYCDKLSTSRAREVAQYLILKGVDANRITYKGYGKRVPIESNKTREGRKKNQRVEIKILSIG